MCTLKSVLTSHLKPAFLLLLLGGGRVGGGLGKSFIGEGLQWGKGAEGRSSWYFFICGSTVLCPGHGLLEHRGVQAPWGTKFELLVSLLESVGQAIPGITAFPKHFPRPLEPAK